LRNIAAAFLLFANQFLLVFSVRNSHDAKLPRRLSLGKGRPAPA
jgi:hypothetical protein